MEYTRIQIALDGGGWRRGARVTGAVDGPARAVVVVASELTVAQTIVTPRRARQLPSSAMREGHAVDESAGLVILYAGTVVRAARAPVGRLSRVWCRVGTGRVTHLLVREADGWARRGQERIVPADYIAELSTGGVALKVGASDFGALPTFRADDAILADVQLALEAVLADPRARRAVKVRVADGEVTLAGEVDTTDQRRFAERAVSGVPGVRALVVDLVAQETLAALVEARIAALGQAVMNGHGPIQVFSEHGIVYLEGSVPSVQARQEVERAALAAAGTKVVVNNLRINGEPPERGQGTGPLVRNK